MMKDEYCEAETFAQSEIERSARAAKRERKLMDRETHKKKKSVHSGKKYAGKYAGFEYSEEEELLREYREYGF